MFQVKKIYSDIKPNLFQLVDLQKANIPGRFYREELTKSPAPKEEDYFFVEKILKHKKVRKKDLYLVKFLYYPAKFNQWLPKENLISRKGLILD